MTIPVLSLDRLAKQINAEHEGASLAASTAISRAIECGRLLAEAKAAVDHGGWLAWIENNLIFGARQAQKYLRLADRADELPNATSDAHLSIDGALQLLAEPKTENEERGPGTADVNDVDQVADPLGWAERQINGPFNAFDFEGRCAKDKLYRQTGVPPVASYAFGLRTETIPIMRIVPTDELVETVRCLAPVANGDIGGLQIDFADISANATICISELEVRATWAVGRCLRELEYREKTYPEDEGQSVEMWRRESAETIDLIKLDLDARLKEIKTLRGGPAACGLSDAEYVKRMDQLAG